MEEEEEEESEEEEEEEESEEEEEEAEGIGDDEPAAAAAAGDFRGVPVVGSTGRAAAVAKGSEVLFPIVYEKGSGANKNTS